MDGPKISNMVKFYTVVLLLEKPLYGYELMKEIGSRLEQRVSPGQMYPFLAKLEKSRIIESAKRGKREKIYYRLTGKGKKFAVHMLERFGGLIEIALKPRLSICTHCGCKVFQGGVTEKIGQKKMKFCCHHCAQSYKKKKH
ncbi:MAG: PadR family transcriptional regulator [Candidatus Diapherotrites archaeon]|nr:PadR family transcriptional regulator [Candidatus Diapherotrites archaeon]